MTDHSEARPVSDAVQSYAKRAMAARRMALRVLAPFVTSPKLPELRD